VPLASRGWETDMMKIIAEDVAEGEVHSNYAICLGVYSEGELVVELPCWTGGGLSQALPQLS